MTKPVHLIYFSATGTTRKIVDQIAAAMPSSAVVTHDLTRAMKPKELQITDGLAIIGIPVYAGRVPEVCLQRMRGITAQRVPAVLVVLYGNREFEDALVELQDLAEAQGFNVLAAAAFIGEHSYSTPLQPVAAGRPDEQDLRNAAAFGLEVAARLVQGVLPEKLLLPGNRPYRDRLPRGPIAPASNPVTCTSCAACVEVCPTSAIRLNGALIETCAADCILCCACVKACPEQARTLDHPVVTARREMLVANCGDRKEPVCFLG